MGVRLTPAGWRRLAALTIGLALLYGVFEYGRSVAGYTALSALMQRQALASRIAALTEERDQLQRRIAAGAAVQRADEEAQSEAQAMIGELQAELARQQQELEFYRGLVAERFGTGTVKVQELAIRPEGGDRYLVSVTLVHTATRDATASGWLTLAVNGSRGGSLARLELPEMTADGGKRVDFSLRYLTTVEVEIGLPADFSPASVELEFRTNRSGPEPVTQSFPWSGVLSGAAEAVLTPSGAPE
jgi:hypothetical protein